MATSELNNYKKNVRQNITRINEIVAAIKEGRLPGRSEPLDTKDEFSGVISDIYKMAYDVAEKIKKLEADNKNIEKKTAKSIAQIKLLNKENSLAVAERNLLEEAYIQEEIQYRTLAESALDYIFVIDENMVIRYVNEFAAKEFNCSPIDIIGKDMGELFPAQVYERFKTAVLEIFATNKKVLRETKTEFPNKKEIWLETNLAPIRDKNGKISKVLGIARDITKQKSDQQEIIDREKFYSNIFSSILDGIIIVDKKLNIVKANSTIYRLHNAGIPFEGKKCYEVIGHSDHPCNLCPAINTLNTGKSAHEIISEIKNNGTTEWTDLHTFPLIDSATGEITGVIENIRDISDRKNIEKKLRQSEENFRTLAETVSAGLVILKNEKFCYANQYFLEVSGYTLDELCSMNYLEIVNEEYMELIRQRQINRLKGMPVERDIEYKAITKNGKELWVHQSGGLIKYEGETATLATIWDISEQKNIEQALADEKERLDVTLSSIGDSVISADIDLKIITINKAAETLTGYTKEEAIGRPLNDICRIVNETTHKCIDNIFSGMVRKNGIVNHKKHVIIQAMDGSEYRVDMSASPINSDNNSVIGMVLVLRDISERQKLETELFKARKLESLGVLAGGIAHDFNNILTGIITNLFMAKISMPIENESYKMIVDAEKACFRASRLTKQLLTFSRGGAPVKEVASVKELIEETVGFCLAGSNADYRLEIPDDLPAATIDKGQIDQVLNNLLINALQAMPAGGTITVTAESVFINDEDIAIAEHSFSSLTRGNYIKVSIKDEGVGISPKDMEKIFDPYYTTKPQGTGLGLTTSYSIIKNHNGVITVESKPGKGSVFSFFLPALEVSLEIGNIDEKNIEPKGGSILIMDDDEAVRTVVTQLLSRFGYKVCCACTGNEAIEQYKSAMRENSPFDVVLMDLTIPGGIGGKEVVKILQEVDPGIKAIVSSGYSNDPVMANFSDYGFCGVIVKPFNIDDFVKVVDNVMNS
jgi:PAS domain S-box-containing protein